MLIDNEEVIVRQLRDIKQEFSSQIASVRRELEVQWEVLSRLLLFIAPITITWALTMFVRLAGNRAWEGYAAAVSCGVILSVLIFDLQGLLNVILEYANIRGNLGIPNTQSIATGPDVKPSVSQDKETNTDGNTELTNKDIRAKELPLSD